LYSGMNYYPLNDIVVFKDKVNKKILFYKSDDSDDDRLKSDFDIRFSTEHVIRDFN
jgi:hypothetical protein